MCHCTPFGCWTEAPMGVFYVAISATSRLCQVMYSSKAHFNTDSVLEMKLMTGVASLITLLVTV